MLTSADLIFSKISEKGKCSLELKNKNITLLDFSFFFFGGGGGVMITFCSRVEIVAE